MEEVPYRFSRIKDQVHAKTSPLQASHLQVVVYVRKLVKIQIPSPLCQIEFQLTSEFEFSGRNQVEA